MSKEVEVRAKFHASATVPFGLHYSNNRGSNSRRAGAGPRNHSQIEHQVSLRMVFASNSNFKL